MKKIQRTPSVLKAAIVFTVALALVVPGVAVFTNTSSEDSTFFTLTENQEPVSVESYKKLTFSENLRLADEIIFATEGEDVIPCVTQDDDGYTIITYTNWEDPIIANFGILFSDDPTNPDSWEGWIIKLSGMDIMNYVDTAFIQQGSNAWGGLFGTFISEDMEQTGGYAIDDITADPSTWMYYTWQSEALEPMYACVDDGYQFQDLNYPEYTGPFHMYIYHEIYDVYDIPDCPISFHTGLTAPPDYVTGGVGYFDAQSELLTAPAKDPDTAQLEDRFHLTWEYHNQTTDVDQIVWKKIVPASQPDVEYTPYQQYVGDGTHPSIAASEDVVAVVYEDDTNITVAYSDDDGDTWTSQQIAEGTYPDIEIVGGILYATYIVSGDLFLVTSGDGGATWSAPVQLNTIAGSVVEEENSVDIHAGGISWVTNSGADYDIAWIRLPTESPDTPNLEGPNQIKVNTDAEFTATAEDPQDDTVAYKFDWGNGEESDWTEFVGSGTSVSVTYAWDTQGDYEVRVKAKDDAGHESDWSAPHPITVPRNKGFIADSWFLQILEQYFPVLYNLVSLLG